MIIFFVFLFGLTIGSFLNSVIWRLHSGESPLKGRSLCPKCQHTLGARDLVPLLSFIIQKGRCRYCGKKISWQYPSVELATAILFCLAYLKTTGQGIASSFTPFAPGPVYNLLLYGARNDTEVSLFFSSSYFFFISILIIIFVYDLKYYLIPTKLVLIACLVALVFNLASVSFISSSYFSLPGDPIARFARSRPVLSGNEGMTFGTTSHFSLLTSYFLFSIFSAIIGGSFFLWQFLISRGKWIGQGDIWVGVFMGLILGWPHILIALFLAYLVGAVVSLVLIITGKKTWKSQVPFGPFLTAATIITLLWGEEILRLVFN